MGHSQFIICLCAGTGGSAPDARFSGIRSTIPHFTLNCLLTRGGPLRSSCQRPLALGLGLGPARLGGGGDARATSGAHRAALAAGLFTGRLPFAVLGPAQTLGGGNPFPGFRAQETLAGPANPAVGSTAAKNAGQFVFQGFDALAQGDSSFQVLYRYVR